MRDEQENYTTELEKQVIGVDAQQEQIKNAESEHKSSPGAFFAAIILIAMVAVGGFLVIRMKNVQPAETPPIKVNVVPTTTEPAKTPETKQPVVTPTAPVAVPEKQPDLKPVTEIVKPKQPDKVVEEFYNWYKNNKIPNEAYKTNQSLTSGLLQKIESAKNTLSYDPFLCSNNNPSNMDVGPATISGSDAGIIVNLSYSGGMKLAKVNLKLNGGWKMNNITCILENGVVGILENLKLETALEYVTVVNTNFYWTMPDYKGRAVRTIKGKGFSTTNADVQANEIQDFLTKNGFKTDKYNPDGYKKGDIVCDVSTKTATNNKLDVDVACGKLLSPAY